MYNIVVKLITNHKTKILTILIFALGTFLRLYKIDFGRPQSFLYDENDIYDDVIRYSQNYKFIINQEGFEGFEPNSYVYGMFPTYFLILATMILNKSISVLHVPIDFNFYFVYMRIITSLFSVIGIVFTGLLYKKIFKDKIGTILAFLISALNWKLIAHSHYLNHDTYLMVLTTLSLYFLVSYLQNRDDKKYLNVSVSAFFLGLAVGTKITGLIIAPIIGLCLIHKKDWESIVNYGIFVLLGFSISNPFSIINFPEFISRITNMRNIEAGVVFSDINNNPLRYPLALIKILTPPIFIASIYGILDPIKKSFNGVRKNKIDEYSLTHLILFLTILIYIVFYSFTPRMTERWILPIIPILIVYSSKGLINLYAKLDKNKSVKIIFSLAIIISFLIYPISLFKQLGMGKPRVNAYSWFRQYLIERDLFNAPVLMYTNKGYRDPFSRLKNCHLILFNLYEARDAQNTYPKDPNNYDFVVLYSTLEKNYENKYVKEKYPEYSKAWSNFTNTVKDPSKFKLINSFKTTKLNLLGIPEISIYEKIK